MQLNDLLNSADEVKYATEEKSNTALKIGGLIKNIIAWFNSGFMPKFNNPLSTIADVDACSFPGFYPVNLSTETYPVLNSGYFGLYVSECDGQDSSSQIAVCWSGGKTRLFYRLMSSGSGSGGWSEVLSANDVVSVENFIRPPRTDVNFVFDGNSRTCHFRYSQVYYPTYQTTMESIGRTPYPVYLMRMPNFAGRGNYYNYGDYGRPNNTEGSFLGVLSEAKYNRDIKQHRPEANGGQAGITESYLFVMSGILDIISGANPDTEAANFKAYCDRATADGFRVIVLTEYYGANPYNDTYEKNRLKYNKHMIAYAENLWAVVDTDQLIGFDTTDVLHQADTPYFHASKQGNYIIANYLDKLFNAGNRFTHNSISFPAVNLPDLYKKVDKVPGKQLSTNDYTSTEKSKLAAMPVKETLVNELRSLTMDAYEIVEGETDPWYFLLFSTDINLAFFEETVISVRRGSFVFNSWATAVSGGIQVECYDIVSFESSGGDVVVEVAVAKKFVDPALSDQKFNFAKASGKLLPEFSDNSAALTGGLQTGDIYRTGAILKVVL